MRFPKNTLCQMTLFLTPPRFFPPNELPGSALVLPASTAGRPAGTRPGAPTSPGAPTTWVARTTGRSAGRVARWRVKRQTCRQVSLGNNKKKSLSDFGQLFFFHTRLSYIVLDDLLGSLGSSKIWQPWPRSKASLNERFYI